ncbi:MAG: hypothetical protein ACK50Q_08515, partial [Labrys sp. (in: a-proteobacteria)]
MLTTIVLSAIATIVGLAFLLGVEGRAALVEPLLKRFGLWSPPPPPPPPPPLPPPPPPPPPPEPEILYGNIPPIPEEREKEPDASNVFPFPEKNTPTLKYADLNTRLFIVSFDQHSGRRNLKVLRVCDEPERHRGNDAFVEDLIRHQLRPKYKTIHDPSGLFAQHSAWLERNPFGDSELLEAYLAIPRDDRPVVVSQVGGVDRANQKMFVFHRYGFQPFVVPFSFLGPNEKTSYRHLFHAFLADDVTWSNFSLARLRYLAARDDADMARTAVMLDAATKAAEAAEAQAAEEALDRMQGFSEVFRQLPAPQ